MKVALKPKKTLTKKIVTPKAKRKTKKNVYKETRKGMLQLLISLLPGRKPFQRRRLFLLWRLLKMKWMTPWTKLWPVLQRKIERLYDVHLAPMDKVSFHSEDSELKWKNVCRRRIALERELF